MFISDPKGLLDSYDSRITISTIAVAVGILGEYGAHFFFERPSRSDWHKTLITLFFGALVLGGVVGECIFGLKVSRLSKQIQQTSDQTVAALKVQLAELNLQIADSNARAAEAAKAASEANERSMNTAKEQSKIRTLTIDMEVESSRPILDDQEARRLRSSYGSVFLNAFLRSRLSKPEILFESHDLIADVEQEKDGKFRLIYKSTFHLTSLEVIGKDVAWLSDVKIFYFHFLSFGMNVVHDKNLSRVSAILYVNGQPFKIVDHKQIPHGPIVAYKGVDLTSSLSDIGTRFGGGPHHIGSFGPGPVHNPPQ